VNVATSAAVMTARRAHERCPRPAAEDVGP
jgi:hypothetical protein